MPQQNERFWRLKTNLEKLTTPNTLSWSEEVLQTPYAQLKDLQGQLTFNF